MINREEIFTVQHTVSKNPWLKFASLQSPASKLITAAVSLSSHLFGHVVNQLAHKLQPNLFRRFDGLTAIKLLGSLVARLFGMPAATVMVLLAFLPRDTWLVEHVMQDPNDAIAIDKFSD